MSKMSIVKSVVNERGRIPFAAFTGERVYMREFHKTAGLPRGLERWQETVDAMLEGVDVDGPIYLMVDQAAVRGGTSHRRGGVHVDGYWNPAIHTHGNPRHRSHRIDGDPLQPEALILASDVLGCRAFIGPWSAEAKDGGDCSHIDVGSLDAVAMEPGRAYAGHALTMLHESMPLARDALRTVVRLNVPGWISPPQ